MKDIFSINVSLTEKDPIKLHSRENYAKLEMCLQALEIVTAISFAVKGMAYLEHKIVLEEKKMRVSLVYSTPSSCQSKKETRGVSGIGFELETPFPNFQSAKEALAKEGIDVDFEVTEIETLPLPE